MCINHKEAGHYKCCCCCPLSCGVVILAIVEAFALIGNILLLDIYGILTSSIIMISFFIACCQRENVLVRRGLFLIYAFFLACSVVYMIVFCATVDIDSYVSSLCLSLMSVGSGCYDTISGTFWGFFAAYAITVLLLKLFFVRILYYWYQETAIEKDNAYQSATESHSLNQQQVVYSQENAVLVTPDKEPLMNKTN